MSRWLGTREDQVVAAQLVAYIAQLFPGPCGSGFSREGGMSGDKGVSNGPTSSRLKPLVPIFGSYPNCM